MSSQSLPGSSTVSNSSVVNTPAPTECGSCCGGCNQTTGNALQSLSSLSSMTIGGENTCVPESGGTYVIRDIQSKKVIALLGGRLTVLGEVGTRGGWHWHCEVNTGGWIGFREAVSGRYLSCGTSDGSLGHKNNDGYNDGYNSGHTDGHNDRYIRGNNRMSLSYNNNNDGYNRGYNDGYNDGYDGKSRKSLSQNNNNNNDGYASTDSAMRNNECLMLRPRQLGGYNMCVKGESNFKYVLIMDDGSQAAKIVETQNFEEATRWEFVAIA